jgi:hypothetical protein
MAFAVLVWNITRLATVALLKSPVMRPPVVTSKLMLLLPLITVGISYSC